MPDKFIYETAATVDHERDELRVDTSVRSVASTLLRAGFREVTRSNSAPYRRFVGRADQMRFRKAKGIRKVRGRPFAPKKPQDGA